MNTVNNSVCFVSPGTYGFFVNNPQSARGGAQRQLYLISKSLSKEMDVHMVVNDHNQPIIELREGVKLHRSWDEDIPSTHLTQGKKLYKLFTAMRRADSDVYVYRGQPKMATIVFSICKILGKEFVYNIAHDNNILKHPSELSLPMKPIYRYSLKDSVNIISQTNFQKKALKKHFDICSVVIPNGYPTANTVLSFYNRDHFLWVGRLSQSIKRPHLFLQLAEQFPSEDFVILGLTNHEHAYESELNKRIDEMENVVSEGPVSPDEIHEYYHNAIALINTSTTEGFPNTFLEAWRSGTPVVSLDIDLDRYLNSYSTRLYAEGDLTKLKLGCEDLLKESIWKKASRSVKKEFEERYDIKQVSKMYRKALQKNDAVNQVDQ